MQAELKDLQPILEKTSVEVENMMVIIANDKKEAGASLSFLTFHVLTFPRIGSKHSRGAGSSRPA